MSGGVPARAGRRPPGGRAHHGKSRAAEDRVGPSTFGGKTQGVPRVQDHRWSTAILPSIRLSPQSSWRILPARNGIAGCDPAAAGPSLGGTHGPVVGGLTGATAGLRVPDGECRLHSDHSSRHALIKPLMVRIKARIFWARRAFPVFPSNSTRPEPAKAFPMPADHRRRLDEEDTGPPIVPDLAEPGPQESIRRAEFRSLDKALQNIELMAECEDLQLQGGVALEGDKNRGEEHRKYRAERESKENRQPPTYQSVRH